MKNNPSRILVLRYSSLGDVALTFPVLDALKKSFPQVQIAYATKSSYAPLVQNHSSVVSVFEWSGSFFEHLNELKSFNADWVIDLHGSLRTRLLKFFIRKTNWVQYDKRSSERRDLVTKKRTQAVLHTALRYVNVLRNFGLDASSDVHFEVPASPRSKEIIQKFSDDHKLNLSEKIVGMAPGSQWETKRWPASYYSKLASHLVNEKNVRILWFGSEDERSLIQSIQAQMQASENQKGIVLAGSYSLEESISLLGRCDTFITNDSGLMHLAAGRGCKVIALFGSTTPSLGFYPLGNEHHVLQVSLPCRPCHVHGQKVCPLGHFKCMNDLTPEMVFKKMESIYK